MPELNLRPRREQFLTHPRDEEVRGGSESGLRSPALVLILLIAILMQPGCLFRKKKASVTPVPTSPVRIVLLPANIPEGNQDLRWASLGITIVFAKELENAQDLEAVPVWESFPIALETLGDSREITDETSAYIASRLSAQWAVQAQLAPAKNGTKILIDFMPTKSSLIAFRYQEEISLDSVPGAVRESLRQFLRYLAVRPLAQKNRGSASVNSKQLQTLAEALDREHGWFTKADPGTAEKTFENLVRTDDRLAKLLFKPSSRATSETSPAISKPGEAAMPAPIPPPQPPERAPPASDAAAPETVRAKEDELPIKPAASSAPPVSPSDIIESTRSPRPSELADPSSSIPSAPFEGAARPEPASRESVRSPSQQAAQDRSVPASGKRTSASTAGRYWIQVHATRSKAESEEIARRLAEAGMSPQIMQLDTKDKGILYRVRLTGFETRNAAQQVADRLVNEGVISNFWIANTEDPP